MKKNFDAAQKSTVKTVSHKLIMIFKIHSGKVFSLEASSAHLLSFHVKLIQNLVILKLQKSSYCMRQVMFDQNLIS